METCVPNTVASKITIRLAQPDEGPVVRELVKLNAGDLWEWLDWTQVYPYWLLGEVDGVPQGCIMASPGKPFGRVEMLSVNPTLPHRAKAILSRDLGIAGWATCYHGGSQAVLSCLDDKGTDWARIAQRKGCIPYGSGTMYVKPL